MASSTWARKGGSPRYPRQWVVVTTIKQDDEVREFADAVNRVHALRAQGTRPQHADDDI